MKIVIENILFQQGEFGKSPEFQELYKELKEAIVSVCWGDPKIFKVRPLAKSNGVFPIKNNFITHLRSKGWLVEQKMSLVDGVSPGPIDAVKKISQGLFAVEWETGNISSSHRALNKIAVGILQKNLIGGILILPKRSLAKYLTDRIGNYEELFPYFPLYKNLKIEEGFIGVIAIDYDETCDIVELIPKGKDGNAKK